MEFSSSNEFEIPYIEMFSLMRKNIYNYHRDKNSIKLDKTYINQRKSLIALIYKISNRMNFKSKTFYQAVNYLDIIFSKQKNISYNYNLIAAACLITAFKFCENVPLKPTFKRFINLLNEEINSPDFAITKDDLFLYEIIICKILDYKLNYFTIYDFNFFFFGNGILKSEHLKEINNTLEIRNSLIKDLLIKIYEKSKYYLNIIINNLICLKYNSLVISICIMEKSIDYILIKEFNREDSFNIDDIKRKNKKYFWEIMKDIYKIEYESLEDYQYLKLDCEKYKIFEDSFNTNDFDLNKSQNLLFNKKFNSNITSSKSITKNKIQNNKNEESFQDKKYNKKKNKFLYKKVNISCLENKKNNNENNNRINKEIKESPKIEQDNKNVSNINNTSSKRTLFEFYQNNHFRNSVSNKKDYYFLKKCNTSSSQFKNFFNKKAKLKEINNINNIKRIDSPDSNSNSFDEMKEINNNLLIKNKNVNLAKPYKKKIIYNHDKTQYKINNNNIDKTINNNINNNTNNNININININNRILYEEISKSKYRGRSTNKIIISKYVDDNDNSSNGKGRNMKYQSKAKIINKYPGHNFESSPIYKRNISNSKYNISFKKNPNNDESYNKMNLNSSNINEEEKKNNKTIKYKINKLTDIKYNDIPNSSLTSRNSFQYPKHDIKLTDSFVNIQMNYFNNDINNKNVQNNNKIKYIDNYESLNKYNRKDNIKNNTNSESNLINKYQNNINNNFNINFNYINEKI